MGAPGIHLNEHVDGSCQGEDVAYVDVIVTPVGPSVSQVQELYSESAGVRGGATATTRSDVHPQGQKR